MRLLSFPSAVLLLQRGWPDVPYQQYREAVSWYTATALRPSAPAASAVITSDWLQVRAGPPVATATDLPVGYHDRRFCAVAVFTDQASAANGLQIEQSNDDTAAKNVHRRRSLTVPADVAANPAVGSLLEDEIVCKYVRYKYTAGAAAPTAATFTLMGEVHDL